jgi:hypothetical protein
LAGLGQAVPAGAGTSQGAVVQTNPSDSTPHLAGTGAVAYAVWQVGATTYVGGKFASVQPPRREATVARNNIVAFDGSGTILQSFAPKFDGAVWGIRDYNGSLYAVGTFNNVTDSAGTHPRRGVVKLNPTTGQVDDAFNASATIPKGKGHATDIRVVGGRILISGDFPKALAALDPSTGADTNYINLNISGRVATNAGNTNVYRFAVNNAGTRLVAIGNFTSAGGQRHYRAFMVNLGTTATINPWRYVPLEHFCHDTDEPAYLNDVDFDPSGSYFVLVATGAWAPNVGTDVCDAAARFETNTASPTKPTWINYTGGDTLQSVAVSDKAVYVQGHQRWVNNPQGRDSCGPGCVSRPGIAALNPGNGLALAWNPTKDRGVGGKDLLLSGGGLWVVSDTKHIGHEYHYGIAFLPL